MTKDQIKTLVFGVNLYHKIFTFNPVQPIITTSTEDVDTTTNS